MKIISRRMLATTVASRWKAQYCINEVWKNYAHINALDKYNKLVALGTNPHPNTVDAIIGNGSWTSLLCHECNESKEAVVQVGQEEDYDSHTANLCGTCIDKAFDISKGKVIKS